MKKGLFLIFLSLCAAALMAQDFDDKAADIMDKSIEAIGGKSVIASTKVLVIHATVSSSMGINGTVETIIKDEGKLYNKMSMAGGQVEVIVACDGEDCYMENTMQGSRKVDGQEQDQYLSNDLRTMANWRGFYSYAKFLGEDEVEGTPAFKVELKTANGLKSVNFIDQETFLLLRMDTDVDDPQFGKITVPTHFYDYQKAKNGLLFAHRTVQSVMGATIELKVDSIESNVPVPDSKFQLPPSMKQY